MDFKVYKGHCSVCDAPLSDNTAYAQIGKLKICALCAMTTTVNELVKADPDLIAVDNTPVDLVVSVE